MTEEETGATLSLDDLVPVLRLPSLRKLELNKVIDPKPTPLELEPRSIKLEVLVLGDLSTCHISNTRLASLINACEALKIFQYQHDDSWYIKSMFDGELFGSVRAGIKDENVNIDVIKAALNQHLQTFQTMRPQKLFGGKLPSASRGRGGMGRGGNRSRGSRSN
ncbi:hypothetical protein K458DRAFT_382242 [Lentithecium fluviatile CBS 122367]|uniref:Uncharacterized protein n=1 Tax=Lentithecium fluviatile CBS 122367 TaxID=1168545 RepID=A0A6G1JJK4_9PLEO|nr:hypothetical protein K458DRAFT_382242 [Lentithecium fluviatile CBS 122367]